jgi:tryptophan halogenase
MELPESLEIRLRAWRERAHAWQDADELFRLDSWTHVLLGQGIVPGPPHPLAAALSDEDMRKLFNSIREPIGRAVAQMPSQQGFIDRYCKADAEVWQARAAAK